MATCTALAAADLFARPDLESLSYDQLRHAIEAIVPLSTESICLAGQTILWHKVTDPDRLLDEAVTTEDRPAPDVDPFWAVAWRAAEGLDAYLASIDLQSKRVLELGAGSGHAGIAAALRGAQVTITDTVDLALLVARLNAWPVRERVRVTRLRWAEQQLAEEPYPIIISSDLVYDPNHFPQLEMCARQHLADGGRWILSEPQRHTGDRFANWIPTQNWHCQTTLIDMHDGRIPIRLFDCTRDERN